MRQLVAGGAGLGQNQYAHRHTQQAEAYHQHAGYRTATEGDIKGRVDTPLGGLSGTHIGFHRDAHTKEAGHAGKDGAYGKADGHPLAQGGEDHDKKRHTHIAYGGVLAAHIGTGALFHRPGDLLHAFVTRTQTESNHD